MDRHDYRAHLRDALDEAAFAAHHALDNRPRRRGRRVYDTAWEVICPSKRMARVVLRKLRQRGCGHVTYRSADRHGRFYMARWRRRPRSQQDRLRHLADTVPF